MSLEYTTINLGGEPRRLRFDLNALSDIEEHLGVGVEQLGELEMGNLRTVRLLTWAGLGGADSGLTEREVGSMIDLSNMAYVTDRVATAFRASIPEEDEVDPKVPSPTSSGIGLEQNERLTS